MKNSRGKKKAATGFPRSICRFLQRKNTAAQIRLRVQAMSRIVGRRYSITTELL